MGGKIFAANLALGCLSKHIIKLRLCEKLSATQHKRVCTMDCRRSLAQPVGSAVNGEWQKDLKC